MPKIEGGCLCGKTRYKSDAEAIMKAICHCTFCQKASGSTYSSNVLIPKDSLSTTGELSCYTETGGSGNDLNSYFCPNCGSNLYNTADAYEGLVILKTGTLDDPSWFKPDAQIWCDSAQPWAVVDEKITKFSTNPE
jgi:hypothetical protein